MDRVKEVVDYCVNNSMYVILNIHWDGGWLENNPTYEKQIPVNAKQKAIWEQIAVKFRDYDEHLLFAGTNEVHGDGTPTTQNFIVQMSYNQTFVNAVRSTGGKNAYRNLVVQAYNTNIDLAVNQLIVPIDSVNDRLMVEVHYYDPWEFCGLETDATWGTAKFLWGADFAQYGTISNWGQEDYMRSQFQKMKTKFVDKGYPVIMGEYGAIRRSALTGATLEHHLASRAYYLQYAAQQAKNYGLVPVVWDNGYTGNFGFGIFNRGDGSVFDRQALKAYIAGAASGSYPF
jgi:endoglucanase